MITETDAYTEELRDKIALEAMKCLLAKEGCMDVMLGDHPGAAVTFSANHAKRAYIYADAMLEARENAGDPYE